MGAFVKIVLWSILYFGVIGRLMLTWLSISPFRYPYFIDARAPGGPQWAWRSPFQDCTFLWDQLFFGSWRVDSLVDLGLLVIFILYYPVWAGICLLLYRSSKKDATKPADTAKTEDVPPEQVWGNNNYKSRRPMPMPQGIYNMSSPGRAQPAPVGNTTNTIPADNESRSPAPMADAEHHDGQLSPEANKRVREALLQLAEKYDMALYDNLALSPGDPVVPFSLALDNCAFLFDAVDNADAEWIPDDACDPNETAYWFSAVQQVPSPFQQLAKQAVKLSQEDIGESPVYAVIVLVSGTIVGADSLLPVWKEKGGMVVRLDDTVPCPDIPLLADYVAEKLALLPKGEDTESEEEASSDDSFTMASEENSSHESLDEDTEEASEETFAEADTSVSPEPVRVLESTENDEDTILSPADET